MSDFQIAITADLHWGHRHGQEQTRALIASLEQSPPDVIILAGDIGTANLFGDCLAQFRNLTCPKLLVPGNHDIWVPTDDERDSLQRYQEDLPRISAEHGFHYLDHAPWVLSEVDLGVVGTINWYDYSWAEDQLRVMYPGDLHRLESKRFRRGRHNDFRFVRWEHDDGSFTLMVVENFARQLAEAKSQVSDLLVVTHHPPCFDLGFPRLGGSLMLDHLLWDAFCGNARIEEVLKKQAEHVCFIFCGHTHRVCTAEIQGMQGYNVGSDYPTKRLLRLSWTKRQITVEEFN